jgi:hypothetical protein
MTHEQLSESDRFRRRLEVRARKYRGTLFIERGERTLELDEVGEAVYRRADGETDLREIGAHIAELYQVPVEQAVEDCAGFLMDLVECGMVERIRP